MICCISPKSRWAKPPHTWNQWRSELDRQNRRRSSPVQLRTPCEHRDHCRPICPGLRRPRQIATIILNLLHNAVKFTPVDTLVDLIVMSLSADEIQISVRDVGPGIAPDDVDKIFQPFYRTPAAQKKTKGAGLGLAITKLLVELHHGRLWVETEPNRGSCFSFTLHSATPPRPATAKISLPSTTHHQIA